MSDLVVAEQMPKDSMNPTTPPYLRIPPELRMLVADEFCETTVHEFEIPGHLYNFRELDYLVEVDGPFVPFSRADVVFECSEPLLILAKTCRTTYNEISPLLWSRLFVTIKTLGGAELSVEPTMDWLTWNFDRLTRANVRQIQVVYTPNPWSGLSFIYKNIKTLTDRLRSDFPNLNDIKLILRNEKARRANEDLDDEVRYSRAFQDEVDHRDQSFFAKVRRGLVYFLTTTGKDWPVTMGFNDLGALVVWTGESDQYEDTIQLTMWGDWIPYDWILKAVEDLRDEVMPERGLLGGTSVLEETCEMRSEMSA